MYKILMLDDILKEVRELTKFCYGLKTELSVISENQESIKDWMNKFDNRLDRLDDLTRELDKENQRRFGYKILYETIMKYWYIILLIIIYVVAGSGAAIKILEKLS